MNRTLFLTLHLFFLVLTSCYKPSPEVKSLNELEGGKTFAVPTGTTADQLVLQRFPDAKIIYYNTVLDCALAVKKGKADATAYDKPVLQNIAGKNQGLKLLPELLLPDQYGFAVAPGDTLLKRAADETLNSLKADGTYDAMLNRWLPETGTPGPMPDAGPPGTDGILRFGTSAVTEPMSYVDSNLQITGFDIELASRIASTLNKRLEIADMEFGAMIPALLSGKVDMIGAGLSITEERAKSVLFTDSYYQSGIAALVKSSGKIEKTFQENGDGTVSVNGKTRFKTGTLGVLMGSIHDVYAQKNYPEAIILPYNTVPDLLLALNTGKVDAAFVDHTSVREIFTQNPGFAIGQENLFTVDIGAGFSKNSPGLRDEFNRFLSSIRADGTYDEMTDRWMVRENAEMPVVGHPNPEGTIRAGVVSDIGLPFTAKSDREWKGFDIELSSRFAAWLGKEIVLTDLPFGSLIPSLVSGKIDMITASMMITEERKKEIDFSDPYYASGATIIIRKTDIPPPSDKLGKLDDIAGKRVGIFTGTVHDGFLERKYPTAKVFRFESTADMMLSLKSEKIDAAMFDRITANLVMKRNPEFGLLSDEVLDMPLGVGFNKNNPDLLEEFNHFLKEIRADGTYETMHERWFVRDAEEAVMPDFEQLPGGKELVVGVSVEDLPYVAYMNGKYVGFDIEMINTFAARRNYQVEYVTIEFPALVAALASGKVDMISDGIAISAERAQQINFSDEYAVFRTSVIALKKNLEGHEGVITEKKTGSLLSKFTNSFYNNIIRENRYLLIIRGLWVTILISVFAALTGTALGGIICYMRMSKNSALNNIAGTFISLIRGTPVLVLLMITYYVIFASLNINPVLVAIIAFGINFAAYVSEMFRSAIESIDKGQKEAGIASGFTGLQTFYHIIMPQALRRVLPVYKGEFISLVKMTSVVGYIAVQDLTKASDIIRSRTFDAFFPLIMAAVIYIVVAWLLTLILDYIEVGVDPKRRKLNIDKELLK